MRQKHRQEEWVHEVSREPQVMAECSTPTRRVFNSLRAGTASMLHNPLMFSSSATARTASLVWRGQERPAWDMQPSVVRLLLSGSDLAGGGHRHQSVWFLAIQTVTPQMRLPHTALCGYVPSFLGGFKQHVEHKPRWVRMWECFRIESAGAPEIKPSFDEWRRELDSFAKEPNKFCHPTIY